MDINHFAEGTVDMPHDDTIDAPEELLRHLRESFGSSYLTLISILQGVLLALTFEEVRASVKGGEAGPEVWLPACVTVLVIAIVWNEYRMGATMYQWVPGLLDSLIPFLLGGLQAALVWTMLGEPAAWFSALAVFYSLGGLAYWNMYHHARKEGVNQFALAQGKRLRLLNYAACGLMAAIFSVAAYYLWGGSHAKAEIPLFVAAAAMNILFLLKGEANWQAVLTAARRSTGK